jgi:16S rRNA (guanine(527)-N(7))-methyltransferase RsmG
VDSLTGLPILADRGIDRFVDLGSGGGFPGLTLAAAVPADRALLVDSIGKKVRFLATVAAATGLDQRVGTVAERAETLAAGDRDREAWPAVTARAVAPLAELIEIALPLLAPGGILVAWKRGDPDDRAGLGGEIALGRQVLAAIDPGGRIDARASLPGTAAGPGPGPGAVTDHRPGGDDSVLDDLAEHQLVVVERGRGRIAASWPRDPATRRRRPW